MRLLVSSAEPGVVSSPLSPCSDELIVVLGYLARAASLA